VFVAAPHDRTKPLERRSEVEADSVRTLVHRPAVDVLPDTTLRALAQTLSEESVGVAVVRAPLRPGTGTRALGLVSERDLAQAIADGADPDTTRAEEIMTADLASTRPDEPISVAAQCMLDNEIRHLPVVDGENILGVLSMRDVLQALLDQPQH
jgi:CBS domain-containing protein